MREDDRVSSNERESFSKEGFILPNHYYLGRYQVIDILQDQLSDKQFLGWAKFMILKYIARVGEAPLDVKLRSYKKASYYLNELINRREETSDPVDEEKIKPSYFRLHDLETVDVIEDQFEEEEVVGAYTGVIIKYLLRAEKKSGLEDYKKAQYYLNRLIEYLMDKLDKEKSNG